MIWADKFRAAYVTTAGEALILRDTQYISGMESVIVAESDATARLVIDRLWFGYERLPPGLKAPLRKGRRGSQREIPFAHGGKIRIVTAGRRAPGIGAGIGRLLFTEFSKVAWQAEAANHIFPAFWRRPNAKVVVESTPGNSGDPAEEWWINAYEGNDSMFHPIFLDWKKDPSCRQTVPEGFELTDEEMEYLEAYPQATMEHMVFRRFAIKTWAKNQDPRYFAQMFPSDYQDGWLSTGDPKVPDEVLRPFRAKAIRDPSMGEHACREIDPPDPYEDYLITADPGRHGAKGDESALTVWAGSTRREVAFWQGREDPGLFARRLRTVQKRYGQGRIMPAGTRITGAECRPAMLAVEANAAACVSSLEALNTPRLWAENNHTPGWLATETRKLDAEDDLIRMLRDEQRVPGAGLGIRTLSLLRQVKEYDGTQRNRRVSEKGVTRHFDRAITALIAANLFKQIRFERLREPETAAPTRQPNVQHLAKKFKLRLGRPAERLSPHAPPKRGW